MENTISNNFWNLVFTIELIPRNLKLKHEINKIFRADKKADKAIMKQVKKSAPDSSKTDLEIKEAILDLDDSKVSLVNKTMMLNKTEESKSLVDYVFWYISDKDATLRSLEKEEIEFCNAISDRAGYGLMYPDFGKADISLYNYKNESFGFNPKFVINLDRIDARINENLAEKIKVVKEARAVTEETAYSPLIFGTDPVAIFTEDGSVLSLNKQDNVPDLLFNQLENELSEIMAGTNYSYHLNDDMSISLKYLTNGIINERIIDTGSIFGKNIFTIISPVQSPSGIVEEAILMKDKDLVAHSLFNLFALPTVDDVYASYFKYNMQMGPQQNVMMFDISDVDTSLMSSEAKDKLQMVLSKINGAIAPLFINSGSSVPRIRILNYHDINDFDIISDNLCKTYLARIGGHNFAIYDCKGTVKANKFTFNIAGSDPIEIDLDEVKEA